MYLSYEINNLQENQFQWHKSSKITQTKEIINIEEMN